MGEKREKSMFGLRHAHVHISSSDSTKSSFSYPFFYICIEELKEKLMTGSISMYTKSVERFIQQHVDALVRGEGLQVSEGTRMKSPCKDALRILLDLALALHGHLGWILDDKVGLGGLWIRVSVGSLISLPLCSRL